MPDSPTPEQVSRLARHLAEHLAPLCPNVPAREMSRLTARLARAELAHAPSAAAIPEVVPLGAPANRVVWLPGAIGAAIVLPAGEEPARRIPTTAELLAHARRHRETARRLQARGATSLQHLRSALLAVRQSDRGAQASKP